VKVLITGGTGFIGSHLVEYLLERGDEITCLVRDRGRLRWLDPSRVKLVEGDCTDPDLAVKLQETFDWVFHLAGVTKSLRREEYYQVNGEGTANLVKALAAAKGPYRFVYLSSLAAAGPSEEGDPLREGDPPRPVSHYGRSKLQGERALERLGASFPWMVVRAPVIYGPRDRDLLPFFQMARRRVAFRLGGRRTFSLCSVEDLVRGLCLVAEKGKAGEIYYCAELHPRTWEEIWESIAHALGVRPVTLYLPPALLVFGAWVWEGIARLTGTPPLLNRDKVKEMTRRHWICDPGKAERELGFATAVPLEAGVRRVVDWYQRYGWL
jgi:nucleoside-diphosphate-sugar epimerase